MIPGHQVPDAVQWHEGMLLAPQHFQLAATRSEELLHYHVRSASPFHWGIRRLRLDTVLLTGGTLRVTELEAVMPDGLLVVHGPGRETPLEADLTLYAEEARRGPLTVHLAVPARRREDEPFAGSLARHESYEGREVADENTGEGAVPVPRLRPRAPVRPQVHDAAERVRAVERRARPMHHLHGADEQRRQQREVQLPELRIGDPVPVEEEERLLGAGATHR